MRRLTLYHALQSRASIARWMLEELGEPYEIHLLDLKKGESRSAAYLAVNPMGKVPALRHGDSVVTEVSAICCYLADEFPAACLNVPVGDPRRGRYLSWLFFAPGCIEPAVLERAFPRRQPLPRSTAGFGDFDTVMDVVARAVAEARPFLFGERFTAADVVVGAQLRYGMMFKLIPERPELAAYVARLSERPAFKRAVEKDARLQAEQARGG